MIIRAKLPINQLRLPPFLPSGSPSISCSGSTDGKMYAGILRFTVTDETIARK